MAKPIFIHAGAHRTGTSSFQMCLSQNRAAIEAAGFDLGYPGRDDIPDAQLRLALPRGDVKRQRLPIFASKISAHLSRISPDKERGLILSEENISGPMKHFHEGRFFPFAHKRLRALRLALEAPPKHVVLVLRSYDELYVSAYRKRAEDNSVSDFHSLAPQFLQIEKGWPWLVKRIREAMQPELLTVLPYEARGDTVDLVRLLVPALADVKLEEPKRTMNLSATDAALEALQKRYRAGETLARPEWQAVIADYSAQRARTGFAEFDPAAKQKLRDRYTGDLEWISRIPGVNYLEHGTRSKADLGKLGAI